MAVSSKVSRVRFEAYGVSADAVSKALHHSAEVLSADIKQPYLIAGEVIERNFDPIKERKYFHYKGRLTTVFDLASDDESVANYLFDEEPVGNATG